MLTILPCNRCISEHLSSLPAASCLIGRSTARTTRSAEISLSEVDPAARPPKHFTTSRPRAATVDVSAVCCRLGDVVAERRRGDRSALLWPRPLECSRTSLWRERTSLYVAFSILSSRNAARCGFPCSVIGSTWSPGCIGLRSSPPPPENNILT